MLQFIIGLVCGVIIGGVLMSLMAANTIDEITSRSREREQQSKGGEDD